MTHQDVPGLFSALEMGIIFGTSINDVISKKMKKTDPVGVPDFNLEVQVERGQSKNTY